MAITFETNEGVEVHLPTKFEVCHQCEGYGTSSAYLGVFTRQDIEDDPEFFEDYRAGRFDRACETCKGQRVVEVVDEKQCDPELLKQYEKLQDELAEVRSIERQERLMEGGWRELGWYGD